MNPVHILLHAGTNDLKNENTDSQITKATIDLATSLKNDGNTVAMYDIVSRLDNLNKANELNCLLLLMCKEGISHCFHLMKIMILSRTWTSVSYI